MAKGQAKAPKKPVSPVQRAKNTKASFACQTTAASTLLREIQGDPGKNIAPTQLWAWANKPDFVRPIDDAHSELLKAINSKQIYCRFMSEDIETMFKAAKSNDMTTDFEDDITAFSSLMEPLIMTLVSQMRILPAQQTARIQERAS